MSAFLVSVVVLLVIAAVIRMIPDETDQSATSARARERVARTEPHRLLSGGSLLLLTVALGAFLALLVVAAVLLFIWTWRLTGP